MSRAVEGAGAKGSELSGAPPSASLTCKIARGDEKAGAGAPERAGPMRKARGNDEQRTKTGSGWTSRAGGGAGG